MEISVKNGEYHAQGSGESHSFGKKRNEHLPGLSARLYLLRCKKHLLSDESCI